MLIYTIYALYKSCWCTTYAIIMGYIRRGLDDTTDTVVIGRYMYIYVCVYMLIQ